jgi:hypothetical protein
MRRGSGTNGRPRFEEEYTARVEALGPVLILLSIPLALRWVPRNRLYGFRIGATLRHDAVWYDVNAHSARQFIVLGAVMVVLEFLLPLAFRDLIILALAVIGFVLITVINSRRANRLASELELQRPPS